MGFFDKVKETASQAASETGRQAKIAQAQMKVKSLQGDVDKAKKELGDVAFDLIDKGEVANPGFDAPMAKIREAMAEVAAKEAEIESLRGGAGETVAAATPPSDTPPAGGFTTPSE